MDGKLIDELGQEGLKVKFEASAKRMIKVDVERYQAYLDRTDMTDAQKEDFLQAMWLVIVSFVELGFGVHPLQEVCGKDAGIDTQSADAGPDRVVLDKPSKDENAHGASIKGGLEME